MEKYVEDVASNILRCHNSYPFLTVSRYYIISYKDVLNYANNVKCNLKSNYQNRLVSDIIGQYLIRLPEWQQVVIAIVEKQWQQELDERKNKLPPIFQD